MILNKYWTDFDANTTSRNNQLELIEEPAVSTVDKSLLTSMMHYLCCFRLPRFYRLGFSFSVSRLRPGVEIFPRSLECSRTAVGFSFSRHTHIFGASVRRPIAKVLPRCLHFR